MTSLAQSQSAKTGGGGCFPNFQQKIKSIQRNKNMNHSKEQERQVKTVLEEAQSGLN